MDELITIDKDGKVSDPVMVASFGGDALLLKQAHDRMHRFRENFEMDGYDLPVHVRPPVILDSLDIRGGQTQPLKFNWSAIDG